MAKARGGCRLRGGARFFHVRRGRGATGGARRGYVRGVGAVLGGGARGALVLPLCPVFPRPCNLTITSTRRGDGVGVVGGSTPSPR
mgnify:CR=1 FL=1